MLAKNSRPIIGKLARIGFPDPATSPRSPLDAKIQSPKGINKFDVGGVGLGIVVALEKSINSGEIPAKNPVLVRNLSRSNPIPVNPESSNCAKYMGYLDKMKLDWENLEDYTFVTRHEPNKSYTRVYCDRVGSDRKSRNIAVFDITPARFIEEQSPAVNAGSDFLSCCHLCQKKLHGKDIYMYRGEKAFCSTECRYQQIVMDERKEKQNKKKKQYCSSEASRSSSSSLTTANNTSAIATADISSSPHSNGQMFYTGILAV